ncbi:MAG: flavodoxin [Clostridiales bacterium]|nr:MAG: flavodoxin [Clostridiales bacterium]
MKTAAVYYSYTGKTKMYLECMREYIDLKLIEIKPKDDIKVKGFKSYVLGGYRSLKKETPDLIPYDFKIDSYDLIIFASPVWAFSFAPAMRSFFLKETIRNKKVSYFFTHQGGAGKTEERFKEILKGNEIIDGLDINVNKNKSENLIKIKEWLKTFS